MISLAQFSTWRSRSRFNKRLRQAAPVALDVMFPRQRFRASSRVMPLAVAAGILGKVYKIKYIKVDALRKHTTLPISRHLYLYLIISYKCIISYRLGTCTHNFERIYYHILVRIYYHSFLYTHMSSRSSKINRPTNKLFHYPHTHIPEIGIKYKLVIVSWGCYTECRWYCWLEQKCRNVDRYIKQKISSNVNNEQRYHMLRSVFTPYVSILREFLTHLPLVPHICVSESGEHWFR